MAASASQPPTSPLLKAAIAAVMITAGLGGFFVLRQLMPRPPVTAEADPPALDWQDWHGAGETTVPTSDSPPVNASAPEATTIPAATPVPVFTPPPDVPVSALAAGDLNSALHATADPTRKLEIMLRLEQKATPSTHHVVAAMVADPDKRVRLEALRIVEKFDSNHTLLMPKVRAMYRYETDPEVKARLDHLLQKFRPQEEARARAREQAMAVQAQPPSSPQP